MLFFCKGVDEIYSAYIFKDLIVLYLISVFTYMAQHCVLAYLSSQESLIQEYKKVCSVHTVRIVPYGRSGRYAVIYFAGLAC